MSKKTTPSPVPQQDKSLPSEVVAFCNLLARILQRCLQEKDPRIMAIIDTSETPIAQESEVSHAA